MENINKSYQEGSEPKPPPHFTGLWITKRPSGDRWETEYVDGVRHGASRYVTSSGVLLREGGYRHGRRHGNLITRAVDGTVLDETEFIDGNGTYRIFNSAKQMTDEIPMQHGMPHGIAKRWVRGDLVELRHYTQGICEAINSA